MMEARIYWNNDNDTLRLTYKGIVNNHFDYAETIKFVKRLKVAERVLVVVGDVKREPSEENNERYKEPA